jgi:hypothetical protein
VLTSLAVRWWPTPQFSVPTKYVAVYFPPKSLRRSGPATAMVAPAMAVDARSRRAVSSMNCSLRPEQFGCIGSVRPSGIRRQGINRGRFGLSGCARSAHSWHLNHSCHLSRQNHYCHKLEETPARHDWFAEVVAPGGVGCHASFCTLPRPTSMRAFYALAALRIPYSSPCAGGSRGRR